MSRFKTQYPQHLCYNRLPLLADIVFDVNYYGTGVEAQHSYPYRLHFLAGDVVFVKTDLLTWFLRNKEIKVPITLVTGVSDMTPSKEDCDTILRHPNIVRWIGCNIPVTHPKITKWLIGVGEPERPNGKHELLKSLHEARIPWDQKQDDICIPFHSGTHSSRTLQPTISKLEFAEYMREIGKHKYVVCMRGNGMDTHRFSEVLLMGSVPVVESSPLDDLYSQFPCIIVDSFDQIDITKFVWDDAKYEKFLDMFWLQ